MSVCPVKTPISLGIHPVWSESWLCAQRVAKNPSFLHAYSEDSDQTGRMPRLIWVFAGRTAILLVLSCRGLYDVFLYTGGAGYSCDFTYDICGWTQDKTDQYDWTRKQGATVTVGTGPRGDHTTGSRFCCDGTGIKTNKKEKKRKEKYITLLLHITHCIGFMLWNLWDSPKVCLKVVFLYQTDLKEHQCNNLWEQQETHLLLDKF